MEKRYQSQKMHDVVHALAQRESIDLGKTGAHMKFEMTPYTDLAIESPYPGIVWVAHTFIQNGDLMGDLMEDPGMWFSTRTVANTFIPIETTMHPMGLNVKYAELDEQAIIAKILLPRIMEDAARFATMWATNIERQGWFTKGLCTRKGQGE